MLELSWTVPAQPGGGYVDDMYLQRLDSEGVVARSYLVATGIDMKKFGRPRFASGEFVIRKETGRVGARDLWSNGQTMWVVDSETLTLHAYELPANAKLLSLGMSDVDFGHFIGGRPKCTAEVANDVEWVTVGWVQAHSGGSAAVALTVVNAVGVEITDASSGVEGCRVVLAVGESVVVVAVTAPDGEDACSCAVTVVRASS